MITILGPLNNPSGAEFIVTVPLSKSFRLQSISGSMAGTGIGMDRRTLVLSLMQEAEAGNVLFRDVLFDEVGPINDINFCAAVGMGPKRRDNLGNPNIINPLPNVSLPGNAVIRFDSFGVALSEIFILVEENVAAHVTLSQAQLKALSVLSGVAVTVLYQVDSAGKVAQAAFFNNNGLMQTFILYPKPNEVDFLNVLSGFPTAIKVEVIE